MRIIEDLKKDKVYMRMLAKFDEDGQFKYGTDYNTPIYSYEVGETIGTDFRALGKYINAVEYNKIKYYEVPEKYRTYEFYANTFYQTYDFIKDNIGLFNRDFFKNLIMTNYYSLMFDNNCFKIMPIEYIDEEMVSLAILNATIWSSEEWLLTVLKRKPEAISEDVWKLAARLYGGRTFLEILTITPEKYKDHEWYLELFKCRYNYEMRCDSRDCYLNSDDKTVLMDYVPKEILTPSFLIELLKDDLRNIARFSEDALETEIFININNKGIPIKRKIWQIAIEKDGSLIELLDLNPERIAYFKSLYPKTSSEYFGFRFHYRRYITSKKEKVSDSTNLDFVLMDALLYDMEGDDPTKAIDNEVKRNLEDMKKSNDLLPIFYEGSVPREYERDYDPEEYLRMMYEKYGIKVLSEHDYLLYKVELPEGFTIDYNGIFGSVIDNNGEKIITFRRNDKFYDRDAAVTSIIPVKETKRTRKNTN